MRPPWRSDTVPLAWACRVSVRMDVRPAARFRQQACALRAQAVRIIDLERVTTKRRRDDIEDSIRALELKGLRAR